METHTRDLEFRLMTIKLLNTIKKQHTYREISQWTGLPVTVLSRYVKGHVLPASKRAREIWESLQRVMDLEAAITSRIKFDENLYFDNTSIICDVALLRLATQFAVSNFAGRRVTKVLTAAVDGIPLATMVANALDVDLVIAKKNREVGVREWIEESFIFSDTGVVLTFYLPKDAIRKGDSVLIIDDIIRTGETQDILIRLVERMKAELAGIFVLVAVGDEWKKRLRIPPNCPFKTLASVEVPQRK